MIPLFIVDNRMMNNRKFLLHGTESQNAELFNGNCSSECDFVKAALFQNANQAQIHEPISNQAHIHEPA